MPGSGADSKGGGQAMRYFDEYPPYVPVAQRRARAERKLKQLRKTQPHLYSP